MNIALQGNDVNTGDAVYRQQNQQNTNAMATEQILQEQFQTMNEREKSRLASTISGAVQLKAFLDQDDLDGAHDFLMKRKGALQNRIGTGESVDTQETDYALEALRSGNVDGLKNEINGLMAAGQVYGILQNKDMPSSVQEWQYYNSLPQADKDRYLTMKRANQVVNQGDKTTIVSPTGAPVTSYNTNLKPEDQPVNAANKASAETTARVNAENNATANSQINKLGTLDTSLDNLAKSTAAAPGGYFENVAADLSNKAGVGGKAAVAKGDFKAFRAAAENEIRSAFKVAGSGAQTDADAKPFIDMLPDEGDADDVKASKVAATKQAIATKIATMKKQVGGYNQQPQAGQKVRVVNQQTGEVLNIDPSDLAAAQAEGFVQQ